MARKLELLPANPMNTWANWCRETRAKTKAQNAEKDKYRGAGWHMNAEEFAAWISRKLKEEYPKDNLPTISSHRYVRWEAARENPPAELRAAVETVCQRYLSEVTHRGLGNTAG